VQDPQSRDVVQYLSLMEHLQDFSKGMLDTRPIVFYASLIAIGLLLTIRVIGSPRWRS
jgi:ABC-2 type transport system permease protein